MKKIFPPKLKPWDWVRVIAPADSMGQSRLSEKIIDTCKNRLNNLWLKVSFWKNVYELNDFNSSSVESRVNDLHDGFSDKSI